MFLSSKNFFSGTATRQFNDLTNEPVATQSVTFRNPLSILAAWILSFSPLKYSENTAYCLMTIPVRKFLIFSTLSYAYWTFFHLNCHFVLILRNFVTNWCVPFVDKDGDSRYASCVKMGNSRPLRSIQKLISCWNLLFSPLGLPITIVVSLFFYYSSATKV